MFIVNGILVVDDDAGIRETLSDIINDHTKRVCAVAQDGFEAITKTMSHHYDLILMDIRMPGISGVDAYKRMISNDPDLHIILMTAGSTDVIDTFYHVIVLSKPIDIPYLLHIIDSM